VQLVECLGDVADVEAGTEVRRPLAEDSPSRLGGHAATSEHVDGLAQPEPALAAEALDCAYDIVVEENGGPHVRTIRLVEHGLSGACTIASMGREHRGAEVPAFVCSSCGRTDLPPAGDWDPPICEECDAAINFDADLQHLGSGAGDD
jgi:hypothetical protein